MPNWYIGPDHITRSHFYQQTYQSKLSFRRKSGEMERRDWRKKSWTCSEIQLSKNCRIIHNEPTQLSQCYRCGINKPGRTWKKLHTNISCCAQPLFKCSWTWRRCGTLAPSPFRQWVRHWVWSQKVFKITSQMNVSYFNVRKISISQQKVLPTRAA